MDLLAKGKFWPAGLEEDYHWFHCQNLLTLQRKKNLRNQVKETANLCRYRRHVIALLTVSCELVLNSSLAPPWVHVFGTLVEAKMCIHNCTFTLEYTHFIFNKCPIYNHDGASAKFSTNSHEMDYSVMAWGNNLLTRCILYLRCTRVLAPQFFSS